MTVIVTESSKTDSSKVIEVKKTDVKKKISNRTQSKLIDIMKSNKKITLAEAIDKLKSDNELAGQSNRTSAKNTEVMNQFKSEFDALCNKYAEKKLFKLDKKNRVTTKDTDTRDRWPKMYFATKQIS